MKYDWKCWLVLIPVLICAVIILTDKNEPEQTTISASTETERKNFLLSNGWEGKQIDSQKITVPEVIDENYSLYYAMQKQQNLPLPDYLGKEAVIYTYQLENSGLYAELLTSDGILIGVQYYDPLQGITLDKDGKIFTG